MEAEHDVPAQVVPRTHPILGETKVTEAASNPCGTVVPEAVVEEVDAAVVVEVVEEPAEWTVVGVVGREVVFGVPPPQAASMRGRANTPKTKLRRTPLLLVVILSSRPESPNG